MITNLYIGTDPTPFVPHTHAGADFQMSTRWDDSCCGNGNLYNPTLGGDCVFSNATPVTAWQGNPSCLVEFLHPWHGACLPNPPTPYHGSRMKVIPRLYNDLSIQNCPACLGPGPYASQIEMAFGVTLGDSSQATNGLIIPSQAMIIDMELVRRSGMNGTPNPPVLDRELSEVPVAFPFLDKLPYAFYSEDGTNWKQLWLATPPTPMGYWPQPTSNNMSTPAPTYQPPPCLRAVALCSEPTPDTTGVCLAFYADIPVSGAIGPRLSNLPQSTPVPVVLNYLGLFGSCGSRPMCELDHSYWLRRLVVVGNLSTLSTAISQVSQAIGCWGNWNVTEVGCDPCDATATPSPSLTPVVSTECPTWTPTATATACAGPDCSPHSTATPCSICTPTPTPNYCSTATSTEPPTGTPTPTACLNCTATNTSTPKHSPTPTATPVTWPGMTPTPTSDPDAGGGLTLSTITSIPRADVLELITLQRGELHTVLLGSMADTFKTKSRPHGILDTIALLWLYNRTSRCDVSWPRSFLAPMREVVITPRISMTHSVVRRHLRRWGCQHRTMARST